MLVPPLRLLELVRIPWVLVMPLLLGLLLWLLRELLMPLVVMIELVITSSTTLSSREYNSNVT